MMLRALRLLAILLGIGLGAGAQAHEVRPGYLELHQTGPETWDVLWKVPARGDLQLAITPAWPDNCAVEGAPRRFATGGAATERGAIRCAGGLTGRTIAVSGLSRHRDRCAGAPAALGRHDAGRPSHRPDARFRGGGRAALDRRRVDLSRPRRRAHPARHRPSAVRPRRCCCWCAPGVAWSPPSRRSPSPTASRSPLATLGFVHVPPPPVEAAIALSIVFVAAEIVHGRKGRTGLTERWPWVVAFAFGLLHGLGFAGALREVGLPEGAIPTALLFFNLGVELGQLAFVGVVLALLASLRSLQLSAPAWSWRLAPYGIGAVAMYWTIERVVAFAA